MKKLNFFVVINVVDINLKFDKIIDEITIFLFEIRDVDLNDDTTIEIISITFEKIRKCFDNVKNFIKIVLIDNLKQN